MFRFFCLNDSVLFSLFLVYNESYSQLFVTGTYSFTIQIMDPKTNKISLVWCCFNVISVLHYKTPLVTWCSFHQFDQLQSIKKTSVKDVGTLNIKHQTLILDPLVKHLRHLLTCRTRTSSKVREDQLKLSIKGTRMYPLSTMRIQPWYLDKLYWNYICNQLWTQCQPSVWAL